MMNNLDRKNFIWNFIGLTINAFNSFFFLVIVKHINGIDDAGIFTYAFSLSMLAYVVSNYYNRAYQVSNNNNNKFCDYFFSRIIFSIIALIFTILFSIISGFNVYKILIILLLLLFKVVESISDCYYALFQDNNNLYKAGISYTLKGLIGLLLFLIIDLLTKNMVLSIISLIVINLMVFSIYDVNNHKKFDKNKFIFNKKAFVNILKKAFPVFIFSFLSVYLSNLPKYVLTYFVENDIQTIFGIIIMPATMISLVGTYIIMPFLNKFKKLAKENNNKGIRNGTLKILSWVFVIDLLCCGVAYLLGIPVLNLIYNMELNKYRLLLIVILLSAYFNASSMIISNVLTVKNENNKQLCVYLFTSLVSTILYILLIKQYSVDGAVYTYLISCLLLFIGYLFLLFKKTNN